MPWHRVAGNITRPKNVSSQKPYNGVNILALWAAADAKGYQSGTWGTYRQWAEAGAQVCRGEKSSLVVFYKQYETEEGREQDSATEGQGKSGTRMFARATPVFALEQTEGFVPPAEPVGLEFDPITSAEAFIAATRAKIVHGGSVACYIPSIDAVRMPNKTAFMGTETSTAQEAYYSTLFHETGHWTGNEKRLNREFGKRFGDNAYAVEELTAELTAAFLCADHRVSLDPRPDHAQYLASWLKVLKADNRAIFTAAARASAAVSYLNSLQPTFPSQRPDALTHNIVA